MSKTFFSKIKNKTLKRILIFSFGISIISILIMAYYQQFLVQYSIVDFEFSGFTNNAYEIMSTWREKGLEASIFINYYDFLFIIGYGGFLWSSVLLCGRKIDIYKTQHNKTKRMSGIFALFVIIAAICDVVENINLLIMQYNHFSPSSTNAIIASIFALIKFSLLLLVLLFIFACMFHIFKRKRF